MNTTSNTYAHLLEGDCRCGVIHSPGSIDITTSSPTSKRMIATYDYLDERGQLVYQVVRFEPKGFAQRRPDGNGGWIWNLDGVTRLPYRLSELLAADRSEIVFVCEGEKDVDRLRTLGLAATCNSEGAEKFRPELAK